MLRFGGTQMHTYHFPVGIKKPHHSSVDRAGLYQLSFTLTHFCQKKVCVLFSILTVFSTYSINPRPILLDKSKVYRSGVYKLKELPFSNLHDNTPPQRPTFTH